MPTPFKTGTKDFGDGDSWVNWWLFKGNVDDDTLQEFCESNNIEQYPGHPGGQFAHAPHWHRSRSYTLLTQHAGYDV